MTPPTSRPPDKEPLLRPTPNDLALAPELGVLAALDATAATAAYQLTAEHPEIGLDALAGGYTPDAEARKASALVLRIHVSIRPTAGGRNGASPLTSST